jgi:hypothetical protein
MAPLTIRSTAHASTGCPAGSGDAIHPDADEHSRALGSALSANRYSVARAWQQRGKRPVPRPWQPL